MGIAQDAGAVVLRHHERGTAAVSHKSLIDLVTTADKASEALVLKALRKHFPDHDVLAEESGAHGAKARYRWLIDPLDGTNNFAHGLPHFCVLIALQERLRGGERTLLGVAFDPVREELFVAQRGTGAAVNGKAMRASRTPNLINSIGATGFPVKRLFTDDDNHREFCRLNLLTQGVRRLGSAGLDLAYVASGRMEFFWEYKLNPWDVAAGALMVEEAGGKVTRTDGAAFHTSEGTILATNGKIHAAAVKALSSARALPVSSREGLAKFLPPAVAKQLQ